jgi:hypothetical protein
MSSFPDDLPEFSSESANPPIASNPLGDGNSSAAPKPDRKRGSEASRAQNGSLVSKGEDSSFDQAVDFDDASASPDWHSGEFTSSVTKQQASGEVSAASSDSMTKPKLFRNASWLAVPAWLISLLIHVVMLVLLAAVTFDPIREALSVVLTASASNDSDSADALEEFDLSQAASMDFSETESEMDVTDPVEMEMEMAEIETEISLDAEINNALSELADSSLTNQLAPSSMLSMSISKMSKLTSSRTQNQRREMLEQYGGNGKSEKAVARALLWLKEHQMPDGSWSVIHTAACNGQCDRPGQDLKWATAQNGATALALLPFLGAGQTHMEGEYKEVVYRGLEYLIKNMDVQRVAERGGSWAEGQDNLYSHGLASIAMCEAYAMTKDPMLAKAAQLSIGYIAYAQDPNGGGWRYSAKQAGDTSAVGWQIMALKSGNMGGLAVPIVTLKKAERFLDYVQMNEGAFYGYDRPSTNLEARKATTACGLLCRMYMGWPRENPALKEGITWMSDRGPDATDMYYNYYATQVLKQYEGPMWQKWNLKMRDQLVESQIKNGHAAGSWGFDANDHASNVGGRLYMTCMAAMTLEVYYRFLPIYAKQTDDDAFKL